MLSAVSWLPNWYFEALAPAKKDIIVKVVPDVANTDDHALLANIMNEEALTVKEEPACILTTRKR